MKSIYSCCRDASLTSLVCAGPKIVSSAVISSTVVSTALFLNSLRGITNFTNFFKNLKNKRTVNKITANTSYSTFNDCVNYTSLEKLLGEWLGAETFIKKKPENEKIMIISDPHDDYDLFFHHMKKQEIRKKLLNEPLSLIILGDFVGSELPLLLRESYKAKKAIEWIRETKEQLKHYNLEERLIVIRGTHEEEAIKNYEAKANRVENKNYLKRILTLRYLRFGSLDKEDYEFLKNLPYLIILEQKEKGPIILSHANFSNFTADKEKNKHEIVWQRRGNGELVKFIGASLLINGHISPIEAIAYNGKYDFKRKIAVFGNRIVIAPYKYRAGGGTYILLDSNKNYSNPNELKFGEEILPVF